MHKEKKILRFVPQKLRKSFANGNPRINDVCIVFVLNNAADELGNITGCNHIFSNNQEEIKKT